MLKTKLTQNLFCSFLGVIVGLVVVRTLAYTAAFSAPRGIFLGFKTRAAFETGLFLWDAIVVYGLGAGVIIFCALFSVYHSMVAPTLRSAALYLAGILVTIYVLVPLADDTPISLALSRQWWAYGLELSLLVSVLLALFAARLIWRKHWARAKGTDAC